jgi:acetolactate synthase I/II/III large subunit
MPHDFKFTSVKLARCSGVNGAESLVATLLGAGVDTCFTNPGTSEMHIVAALDRSPQMRCVLGLFEGVVSGAADGYARMAGKPACTLLHLGPGFANSLANLHNASRAHTPIVNIIGQHATQHLFHDTPLRADIEAIARPYANWLRTSSSTSEIASDAIDAIVAARTAPGCISTLIVPADFAWSEGGTIKPLPTLPAARPPERRNIELAAAMIKSGLPACLLLSGNALHGAGLAIAGQIAAATGAKLLAPYPFARLERGANVPLVERIPYIFEQAAALLKDFRNMILVGADAPRSYFAHPTKGSVPIPTDCEVQALAAPGEDYVGALGALAEALQVGRTISSAAKTVQPAFPHGAITFPGLASAVAAVLPDNAVVVDEAMTSGRGLMEATAAVGPHDWLANTGGSIGIAMPLAVGAAVACPDRRVLCLSADGSGMYTLQALWTMARESLNITTVVYSNRVYGVLKREFSSLGIGDPGPRALDLFEIGHPNLDWVSLAHGMGVPASRVSSLETFCTALRNGFASAGPTLIQVDV